MDIGIAGCGLQNNECSSPNGSTGARTVEKELASLRMGSYTLQESESVADTVGYMSSEIRWG